MALRELYEELHEMYGAPKEALPDYVNLPIVTDPDLNIDTKELLERFQILCEMNGVLGQHDLDNSQVEEQIERIKVILIGVINDYEFFVRREKENAERFED